MSVHLPGAYVGFQITYSALLFIEMNMLAGNGYAGRVIPSVLQSIKAANQNGICFLLPNVSDNSAHIINLNEK